MPAQPPSPAGHGVQATPSFPPSLLWRSYTVGHKLWEICSLLSPCVGVPSFSWQANSVLQSVVGQCIVLSKGKKTDFIALLVFCFCFLTENMADAYCVWLYWEFYLFSVLRGMGPAKPFRENMGPEDILNGKSWVCGTQKRRSQTLCHSEWTLRLARKHTWILILFSATEECPHRASSPHQPAIWTASLSSAWDEPAKPDWPEDSLSQRRRCLKQVWNIRFLHCQGLPTR